MRNISLECDCNDIERALVVAVWDALSAVEEAQCRFCYPGLLPISDIVLRSGLNVLLAGLYLYKMYSILIKRYDVYLKMSASPVPLKYRVSESLQVLCCDVLSKLS